MRILAVLSAVILLTSSCDFDNESQNNLGQIDRINFIKGKNIQEIKNTALSLTFSQQKLLWISKIDQILTTNLVDGQRQIILKVRNELESINSKIDLYNNERLKSLFIDLSRITGQDDIVGMFMDLRDFSPLNNFRDNETAECIDCIQNINLQWDKTKRSLNKSKANQRSTDNCNCDWTCSDGSNGLDCSTDECTDTTTGCGFLFLFSCEKKNTLC